MTGDHDECFRFWEAIQAGSIPVFVKRVWGMRKTPERMAFLERAFKGPPIKRPGRMLTRRGHRTGSASRMDKNTDFTPNATAERRQLGQARLPWGKQGGMRNGLPRSDPSLVCAPSVEMARANSPFEFSFTFLGWHAHEYVCAR